ncbi:MAG: single-stranded DNA-binding protein [Lachnospiraceae bacterium]|nr:single-stranded DNA-binding protein [Lachnospiraceae bacterium]MCD8124083.1 single-stranded DNA-binding protein [Lachnospiraceae bacterium]
MSEKMLENNKVNVIGEVAENFTFSHEVFGEGFYLTTLLVNRLSDQIDEIPLMVSERLMDVNQDYRGGILEASGQFRSFNRHEGNRNRLVLSVFAREIHFPDDCSDYTRTNQIFLDGYLCKEPVYRKTPLGREIADLLLAVNRPYGKSDYIPCIAWGRNARYAAGFRVGSRLRIWGRVQSREYTKKTEDAEAEKRIAYEVSVSKLECVE